MRKFIPVVVAAQLAAVVPIAFAADGSTEPAASASVVRVEQVKHAPHKVFHRRFRPWRHPSAHQVQMAIRAEAARWHIPAGALSRRVACESHYNWWASNGQYSGVLQFSYGTFQRGVHTLRDRRVRLVKTRVRKVHDARIYHYSDGRVVRKNGRPRTQRLTVVYKGYLPRHPSVSDTWTQLRIGAQAIRGISAVHSSEWSCGA
jgi:hypothetical protein